MTPPDASIDVLPLPDAPRSRATGNPRAAVAERVRSRKRRIWLIRRRVAAVAATIFVAVTGVILVRLASGHDPALVAAAARKATATAATGSSSGSTSSVSGSGSSSGSISTVSTSSS